jgi:hypothetical protein
MPAYLSDAGEHINLYLSRKRTELQAMRDAAQDASQYFLNIMVEKELPSLRDQLLSSAFQMALAAVPAALAMQATWKALAEKTPKFLSNLEALEKIAAAQENLEDLGKVISPAVELAKHEEYDLPQSMSGFMLRVYRNVTVKINHGIAELAREETVARMALANIRKGRTPSSKVEAELVRFVGPLPDQINEYFLNALPFAYLYELFRLFTAASVKVIDWQ